MKAAYIRTMADIEMRETSLWPLAQDEIRIAVKASGICGTDIANAKNGLSKHSPFGHEVAGTVVETGSAVTRVKKGDTVALESASACGACDNCKDTEQELCTDIKSFFHKTSFGMAEEMISPALCTLPTHLSPDIACLSEPLGVAIDMIRLADITPDSNVLIIGPGTIGLMALSLVKRMGARSVFMSGNSTNKARIAAAERFGASIINPDRTPLASYKFPRAIDRIIVTAPPTVLPDAFTVAAKGAIISFIGIGHGEHAFCRFDVNAFHFKKLQLRASFASPALYTPLALRYLSDGVLDGNAIISHRFPLSEIQEAMNVAADSSRSIKVIVMPEQP
ncbi:MAG: alcohol dehydrogenase catalytic domain-containing protein [Spirochaetota bacterium]